MKASRRLMLTYEERYQSRYGFLRPILQDVVSKFLDCGYLNRGFSLIDDREVVESIIRYLGLWGQGVRVFPTRAPPEPDEWVIEPYLDDPFPDYHTEPVMAYANG